MKKEIREELERICNGLYKRLHPINAKMAGHMTLEQLAELHGPIGDLVRIVMQQENELAKAYNQADYVASLAKQPGNW